MRRGEGGGALLEGPKDTMDGSTEPALNTPLPYPRHNGGYAFHHAKFPDRNGFVVIYPQAVLPPLQQVNRSQLGMNSGYERELRIPSQKQNSCKHKQPHPCSVSKRIC